MKKKVMFIIFMILMTGALATTIYIPEDYATIQEGIDVSEDGDEIIVSPGTYVENIDFEGKAITLGSLFYTTQDTSYISQTIIDGNQNGSVVTFESDEDSTSVLTGFTITNGYVSYYGGGISCYHSSPGLGNVTITGNSARYGGGLCCRDNSNPGLADVTITDNSARRGGGIYFHDSSPVLEDVTITNNLAEDFGGGIYCIYNSSPSLDNVRIANNSAHQGGGISCNSSSLSLENVTITDNLAEGAGGGIFLNSLSSSLKNVAITDNSAGYAGGGIFCDYSSPILENVTITGNSAEWGGGGIICLGDSSPVFSSENRCNIYLNNTNNRGNGSDIYSYANMNVIVDTFTVSNPTDFHAAPIENFTFDILHGLQDQINADLYVSPDGNNTNTGLNIDDPLQTIQYAFSVILADSLNLHTIHLAEGTYSPSTNNEFFPVDLPDFVSLCGVSETGVILNAEGAARVIRLFNAENVTISNLTITNGYSDYGGGIYCESSSPSIENVMITNNSAEFDGGGIYCNNSSSPNLENVTIMNNSVENYGGGIYCWVNSNLSLENVTITNNSAEYDGGGICCCYSSPGLENVTITNNSADYGGGIYCLDSSLSFENVTIADNSAETSGGGIYCTESSLLLVNCIFWYNSPHEVEFSSDYYPYTITIAYSDIEGGETGIETNNNCIVDWLEGNIDADPLFVDAWEGDYHLSEDSPCIDAGTNYFEYEGEVLVDLSEDEYFGAAPDMGAYEYGIVSTDECKIENVKCKINTYPNPFNPETNICFELFEACNVLLEIYNIKGQKVTTLVNEPYLAGNHKVTWNAFDQSSGVYLLRYVTTETSETKKLILLK